MTDKEKMIELHLKGRGITDTAVLRAMEEVDRTQFVPDDMKAMAYQDSPLPIGRGQTISQPYIVAYMAQMLDLEPTDNVLEIGSGCGYNAAVISRIVSHVYSIEIIEWLAKLARKNLKKSGITNTTTVFGNGYKGWPEKAPFDKIILTAAAAYIPDTLKNQLKTGGKILAPVNHNVQRLMLLEKKADNLFEESPLINVRFVPMTGEKEA
ncbi:MAG: protein-L-isoaspartate(D-aspartate) O-methyltransferase [Bacteroidales bacterium]